MNKQVGKIGSVRRELRGKACPFCGGHKYQLVLRAHTTPGTEGIFARCSQCHRAKELDEALGRILWM
jgi:cytochrome c2